MKGHASYFIELNEMELTCIKESLRFTNYMMDVINIELKGGDLPEPHLKNVLIKDKPLNYKKNLYDNMLVFIKDLRSETPF